MPSVASKVDSATQAARILALTGTVIAVSLHIFFGANAGPLWRDEVNSLEVATMRTLAEMWANLSFDSFPALFFVILRVFAGVPASVNDETLRAFGVGIGLLILGAVWLNAKWLRLGFPLISLALIGFNPNVIRYGDSIRAYGLGILFALLAVGAMWRVLESFTVRRAVLAALIAVLSVQSSYSNAVLLFAICLGAAAVTLRRRRMRQTFAVFGIGAVAALSLLPYVATMQRVQAWNFMWKRPCTFSEIWTKGVETLGSAIPYGAWLWLLLFLAAVCCGGWTLLWKRPEMEESAERDRLLFGVVTLVLGAICYGGFFRVLSYIMQPWYYVVFVAFAATCIEVIISCLQPKRRALLVRAACALFFMSAAAWPAVDALETRQTNLDLIAAKLQAAAGPDDLIVINGWNYGITFRRYYHGAARYVTIPPVEDLRSHRVDLAKEQMMSPAPLAPVLREIEETLRAGNTVWLIGGLKLLQPGRAPLEIPPGYDGPRGWVGGDFYQVWSEQISALTRRRATSFQPFAILLDQPVARYENVQLSAFQGWLSEADDSRLSYF